MFLKFGDKTKTKDLIEKEAVDQNSEPENIEVYDENDFTNRRTSVLNSYKEEHKKEKK